MILLFFRNPTHEGKVSGEARGIGIPSSGGRYGRKLLPGGETPYFLFLLFSADNNRRMYLYEEELMLAKVLTVATKAHMIFEAGVHIAKTMLKICTIGVIATATLIAQLMGHEHSEECPA